MPSAPSMTDLPGGSRAPRARGSLKIYFGAAPGVGKTFAMLSEGRRLAAQGTDVVVAYAETHDRPGIVSQLSELEVVPARQVSRGSATFEELDVEAVLARGSKVALVDEYAHTNASASRHEHRWEDVDELLEAGIDVVSTLNVQHLESLNDVVESITGVRQRETVPDLIVRTADEIVVVDMTPEALRRRISDELPADRAEQALRNYFQVGNLTALRKLALQWVAERADERLRQYRDAEGITESWDTQERIIVALVGAPSSDEHLLRRAARIAARTSGERIAVRVRSDDGLTGRRDDRGVTNQTLTESLGGRLVELHGSDLADTLVTFARLENATQLVLASPRRTRRSVWREPSWQRRVLQQAGAIDIHLVATDPGEERVTPRRVSPSLPARRQLAAWLLTLVGTPVLALLLIPWRGTQLGLSGVLLVLLLEVVTVALAGGLKPALGAAVLAFGLVDWFYVQPIHSLRIASVDDLLIMAMFFGVAIVVSALGARLARRANDARRARAEADALAELAAVSARSPNTGLAEMLGPLQSACGLDAVAVLSPAPDQQPPWKVEASVGDRPPRTVDDAELSVELAYGSVLVGAAPALVGVDRELLEVFAAQLRLAQERIRLQADAASASVLADSNRLRSAILASVSHDLRTPLASIKAAATSVLSPEVDWSGEAIRSFCEMIDHEADRLNRVVANLLDLSRLQAGSLPLRTRPVSVEGAADRALRSLNRDLTSVESDFGDYLIAVNADATALDHILANLVDNALNWSPPGQLVRISAHPAGDRVRIDIADRGPGIPPERRRAVLQPFQRLSDHVTEQATGIGLGLAVAQGLTEALGGHLGLADTPGGGTTVTVDLPAAS
jgi:two-component system sensor histidine kinase KdpD